MKIIVTGCSGFVGYYFVRLIAERFAGAQVLGIDFNAPAYDFDTSGISFRHQSINMMNQREVTAALLDFRPEYIIHLAAFSSVGMSWKSPVECFHNNTNIILYLLESLRETGLRCRLLSVGSSEEYGNVAADQVPLHEDHRLDPVSPYAVARTSQEMLSKVYTDGYGLDVVMTRSFNHIGPGQKPIFVVPSFAKQITEHKASGASSGILRAGNVDIVRDFLDVRDVVEAYMALLLKGRSGEVYNVCSGEGQSLRTIIEMLAACAEVNITVERDESLIRPQDNMVIIGSNEKLRNETGWSRKHTVDQSLKDILNYFSGQDGV